MDAQKFNEQYGNVLKQMHTAVMDTLTIVTKNDPVAMKMFMVVTAIKLGGLIQNLPDDFDPRLTAADRAKVNALDAIADPNELSVTG